MNNLKTILFVVYTPFIGHLPKRMSEVQNRAKLDNVRQIIVTPSDYEEKLTGLVSDTVHLIYLQPDSDTPNQTEFFQEIPKLRELVEKIKSHNIQANTTN